MDQHQEVVLVLLDLSAAFDTIDHQALLRRMESRFGICGPALAWLKSYFLDRYQRVQIDNILSNPTPVTRGAPQGSVLGPLAFTMFSSPLEDIVNAHNLHCMIYADDTQLYITFNPNEQPSIASAIERCIVDIKCWMSTNMLMLNDSKTEIIHLHSRHIPHSPLPSLHIGESNVEPVPSARNLGVLIDNSMIMSQHVSNICKIASYALYKIGRLRRYLDQASTEKLVHAFVTSRLDNCNSVLFGLPSCELDKLQRIQNAAARLVTRVNGRCHMKPVLRQLHWLPVRKRIIFKILLTTN